MARVAFSFDNGLVEKSLRESAGKGLAVHRQSRHVVEELRKARGVGGTFFACLSTRSVDGRIVSGMLEKNENCAVEEDRESQTSRN